MSYATPFPLLNPSTSLAADSAALYQPNLSVKVICPRCQEDPPNLVENFAQGDLVCASCGTILGDRIVDTRSEWRTFQSDENSDDPSRVGNAANPLLDGDQLDTIIGNQDGGTGLSKLLQRTANRAAQQSGERSRVMAFKDIQTLCDANSLPKVFADIAKQLYKRVDEENLLKGKTQDVVVATCIFMACIQGDQPRSYNEISALTKVDKKSIGQCVVLLKQVFNTAKAAGSTTSASSATASDLIVRFCSQLGLPPKIQNISKELVPKARNIDALAGKNPISVAAAVILFAARLFGLGTTSKEVSQVSNITDTTIRGTYRYLYRARESLIDPKWTTMTGYSPGNLTSTTTTSFPSRDSFYSESNSTNTSAAPTPQPD